MAKRSNFYYVLVLTNSGPTFVTDIPRRNWAAYDKNEKPMEFGTKNYATEVANGLMANFILAYPITVPYEISGQPYRYENGHFEWKENENDGNN